MTTPVSSFLSAVNNPFVFIPEAACMHAAYLAKAKTDGFTYAPKRDNPNKKKPNILPWALLSRSVQASNVGPFESMFSYVAEQAVSRNFADLAELGAFVEGLLDADGNVPDPVLGERTWKVWVPYAREHEPSHPNLVDTYDQVDQGAKDYDFYLNGVAVKFLLSLIREQMAKDLTDAVAAGSASDRRLSQPDCLRAKRRLKKVFPATWSLLSVVLGALRNVQGFFFLLSL